MKKLLLVLIGVTGMMSAQVKESNSPIRKNNYYVGLSSNSLSGLSYTTNNGNKVGTLNVGVEGGYLVTERLAVVGGIGYTHSYVKDIETTNSMNYLVGVKLYFGEVVPIQIDYNGNDLGDRYVGFSGGYNWIVSKHLTVEPRIRYNLDARYGESNTLSAGVGVNYWFKSGK